MINCYYQGETFWSFEPDPQIALDLEFIELVTDSLRCSSFGSGGHTPSFTILPAKGEAFGFEPSLGRDRFQSKPV